MIDRDHKLSITRQARLLNISRGTVYYLPQPVSPADLALMRRIDELHLEHPFMGARMLRDQLNRQGLAVGPASRQNAHAAHGHRRPGAAAGHQPSGGGPQGLPVSAAQTGDQALQSGLRIGYHVHSDGARLRLPHRGGGRGLAPRAGAQGGDHAGGRSRHRGDRTGLCPLRHT